MIRTLNITPEQHYQFSSTVKAVGLLAILHKGELEETSEGLFNGEHIQPLVYHYRKKSSKKTKETTIQFDWKTAQVSTTSQGQQWKMEATPGMLDKLVYQLALMRDVTPQLTKLRYVIADGGKAKEYAVDLLGNETVEIQNTPEATLKLRYQRGNSKRYTLFWCAASYGHLPVRIEYHEDDGQITTATLLNYR